MLVVWSDNLDNIIPLCRDFEDKLIKLVWRNRSVTSSVANSSLPSSNMASNIDLNPKEKLSELSETDESPRTKAVPKSKWNFGWKLSPKKTTPQSDPEKNAAGPSSRPMRLFAPVYNGFGIALSICESILSQRVIYALILDQSSLAAVSIS